MVFLRLFELVVKLAAVVVMGCALARGLSDLLQGKIRGEDVEAAMVSAARQLGALLRGRQSWREWEPGYALLGLLFGLAYGLSYEGALTGIVGAWLGLIFGAVLGAREQRGALEEERKE